MATPTTNATPANPTNVGEAAAGLSLSTGWWVFFGLMAGILTSKTQVAPITLGLLSVALIYQITQLVEGK